MDSLEYIDAFFRGEFLPEEAGLFEQRIREDPAFAAEVAYYISARAVLKESRSEERMTRFAEIYRQQPTPGKIRPMGAKRWLPALAAAVVLAAMALSWLLFFRPANPEQVADRWIGENLSHLSVKMGETDSMQTGLDLYNNARFPEALQQFEGILRTDTLNLAALLDAGIVSLRMGNYDQALDFFRKLSTHTDPSLNPALFYQALTLMKRDRKGDTDLAKQLLRRIVQQDLDKKKDAQDLLAKL
ncbi:MAG TPA: hypothetical protein VNU70_05740 [Puia sp.]|jgi:tetratricopeptide (TPR) repeat protein|nr:hypothetical protein [Puia sp.]